eukprot:scaffold3134_cov414-Prasinococcus_capsulatus_cf.AAC.37
MVKVACTQSSSKANACDRGPQAADMVIRRRVTSSFATTCLCWSSARVRIQADEWLYAQCALYLAARSKVTDRCAHSKPCLYGGFNSSIGLGRLSAFDREQANF